MVCPTKILFLFFHSLVLLIYASYFLKNHRDTPGAGEITQWLGTLPACPDDPGGVPATHTESL